MTWNCLQRDINICRMRWMIWDDVRFDYHGETLRYNANEMIDVNNVNNGNEMMLWINWYQSLKHLDLIARGIKTCSVYRYTLRTTPQNGNYIDVKFKKSLKSRDSYGHIWVAPKPTKKIAREFGFKNQTGCFDPMQGGISLQKNREPECWVLPLQSNIAWTFCHLLIQYNPSLFITWESLHYFGR